MLVIQPSAALGCTDCVREEAAGLDGAPRLLVPPGLHDAQLLRLLGPYRRYRLWRLSFEGVGAAERAYAGFSSAEAAGAFDRRMAHITTDFCCRRGRGWGCRGCVVLSCFRRRRQRSALQGRPRLLPLLLPVMTLVVAES